MIESVFVVVVFAGLLVAAVRMRRRRPAGRLDSGLFVVVAIATTAPAIGRAFAVRAAVQHALWVVPIGAYVVSALCWLIRNRRDIAAAWRAETEDDRRRGLR